MTATQILQLCVKRRLTIKDIEDFESAVRREQIEIDAEIAGDSDYEVDGTDYYDQLGDSRKTAMNIKDAIRAQLDEGWCGHSSDCALHNEPAFPVGPCDCGAKIKEHKK